ncbi:SDR family NAD(P)-dependent oxidoreductase [Maritimibacter fusiformis]|uniref:SDR family NAD(P)-dependent oxidoreductase n=1 Tax=Maritimibacter fusiformis TaxID=2603819 RepID=A0A5D0RAN8_9RHOB|nr:SDR family NAD(P)-dependent oxidoreductase [Maritimibacter fusiformis]TYB77654.1 SDR family NAD(P)-dependent oxidoreductase [Maritimibacter fusiformis]
MPDLKGRRYWLVGASEGLGRALAHALDREGARLVVSARSGDRIEGLAGELTDAVAVPVDVTDPASVKTALDEAGEIDGLIFSAGAYDPVDAKDWQAEAVRTMAEVNFVGGLNVVGAVLPSMIARKTGHIALIGSLSGFRGLPGAVGYGASKAGLMHLAENLKIDLRGTGISVQRMNPGFIRTRLTEKNDFKMPQIMEPEDAAARVVAAMKSGRFSTSFPAPFSWLFTLGQHLPLGLFHRIF